MSHANSARRFRRDARQRRAQRDASRPDEHRPHARRLRSDSRPAPTASHIGRNAYSPISVPTTNGERAERQSVQRNGNPAAGEHRVIDDRPARSAPESVQRLRAARPRSRREPLDLPDADRRAGSDAGRAASRRDPARIRSVSGRRGSRPSAAGAAPPHCAANRSRPPRIRAPASHGRESRGSAATPTRRGATIVGRDGEIGIRLPRATLRCRALDAHLALELDPVKEQRRDRDAARAPALAALRSW